MAPPQTRSLAVLQRRFFMTLSRDLRMAEDSLWDGKVLAADWLVIGRRLILIVLKAFISDPLPRLLVITFFCVLFFHHHAMTQPFRDSFANTVETISLLFLTLLAIASVFFASFVSLAGTSDAHLSSWWSFCQVIEVVIICAAPALFCLLVFFAVLSQLCRLIIVVAGYLWKFIWICVNSRSSNQDNDNRLLLFEGYRSNFADLARKHVALKWTPQRSSVEEDRGLYARRNRGRDG